MKVAFETQRLFRKKKHGMDIVAWELLKCLNKYSSEVNITVIAKDDIDSELLNKLESLEIIKGGPNFYPFWEQIYLPRIILKNKYNILHCTSNTAPLFKTVPLIITIHDIIYLTTKRKIGGNNYQLLGYYYRKFIVPMIAKKADLIITVSEYEKKKIVQYLRIPESKVRVIYNAYGSHFNQDRNENLLLDFRNEFNIPDKFILFFGNTDPKKNISNVLRAWAKFKMASKYQHKLVITDFNKESLDKLLKQLKLEYLNNSIHLPGYIPNIKLPSLYKLSELFLYPSLQESFGLPIIEAMACGIPVITSNTTAMPEIAGSGAVLADPNSPDGISDCMINILGNDDYKKHIINLGLERCKFFSWEKSSIELLECYKNVCRT